MKKTNIFQSREIQDHWQKLLEKLTPRERTAFQKFQERISEIGEGRKEKTKKLNTVQAAEYLGLKPNTLEIWRHQRKGPKYIKLGRRVLYDIDDLEEFTRASTIEPYRMPGTCDLSSSEEYPR